MEPFSFEQVPSSIMTAILDDSKKKPAART
jgi:hypothetical protein